MRTGDKNNLELQIAAVKLWYDGRAADRTQEDVADRLQTMYPGQGKFDNSRVNRLCQYAIDNKLAEKPTPAKLRDTPQVKQLIEKVIEAEQFPGLKSPLESRLRHYHASGRFA